MSKLFVAKVFSVRVFIFRGHFPLLSRPRKENIGIFQMTLAYLRSGRVGPGTAANQNPV